MFQRAQSLLNVQKWLFSECEQFDWPARVESALLNFKENQLTLKCFLHGKLLKLWKTPNKNHISKYYQLWFLKRTQCGSDTHLELKLANSCWPLVIRMSVSPKMLFLNNQLKIQTHFVFLTPEHNAVKWRCHANLKICHRQ